MSWSKVKEPLKKPIGWWYHKILCELSYFIEKKHIGYLWPKKVLLSLR